HATAVNNLVRDDGLIEFGRIGAAIASFALAALAATAALVFGSVSAAAVTGGLGVTWIAGATVALRYALALPPIWPLLASLAALGATIGYRFMIADKGKRLLRQSFALYRAGGDRKNALLQQAAGAGRRDTQRHRLFLRHCRLLRDRGEDPADRIGGGDERIS